MLEGRIAPAAILFIDYGDRFAGGTLATTQGAFRDVANDAVPGNKILGTELLDNANAFNAGTGLNIVAQTFTALERAQILDIVQRAYLPLDVEIVELTAGMKTTSDGRTVQAASSMTDVINTLRAGDPASKDAYVFVATFVVDPGGANQVIYGPGGGGLSPNSPTLGVASDLASASNGHDDVAVVYSGGGFSNNTVNNISHEAGHLLGLRHSITNSAATASINLYHQAEIMSYQNTNSTTSSIAFTRVPMIRGDGNTPTAGVDPVNYNDLAARNGQVTLFDQMRLDPNVGANPDFSFVSGTGAHDIITITKSAGFANVSIQAFADAAYTTPITIPGVGGTTYSYSFPLSNSILLYAGGSNDRIVLDGDLGVSIQIDGMLGNDSLVLNAKGAANAIYTPNPNSPDGVDRVSGNLVDTFGGTLSLGGTTISFENFEAAGSITIQTLDTFTYVTPLAGGDNLTLSLAAGNPQIAGTVNDGTGVVPVILQGVGRLAINTGIANDSLTVDSTNGLVTFTSGIDFDGGAGFDRLNLMQTGGAARTSARVNVGSLPGSGQSVIDTQIVNFANIEPLTDVVPAATFTVTAAPGIASLLQRANTIDYSASQLIPNGGRVTVDEFEALEFSNKTNLVINAGAGGDQISLNNPTTPTGLTGTITAVGGDPTASDTLVVNGVAGILDNLRHFPASIGAGTVVNDSAPQPNVLFSGIEHLDLVVQQADGDGVRVDGTVGNDNIEYFPGATADTGTFRGTLDSNNATTFGPFQMTETTFHGVNSAANDQDLNFFNPGGTDAFLFNGTAADDLIGVGTGEAGGTQFTLAHNGEFFARVETFNITTGVVRGYGGDDVFNHIAGTAVAVTYEGGDPGASDTLNYTAPGGAGTTTIDLATNSIASPGVGLVSFSSLEVLNAVLGAKNLALIGSAGTDAVTLTPVAGITLEDITPNLRVQTTNTGTLNLNLAGADDSLTIFGTGGVDSFTFAGTASDAGTVTLNALPIITFSATEKVTLRGADGDDTFNLDGANGAVTLLGGAGSDRVNFSTAAVGVVFDLDAVGIAQRVAANEATVTIFDRIENFTGTAFNDVLFLDAATFARDINGGLQVSIPPGDKFIFDSLGVLAQVLPTDSNTGTIKAAGFADVAYDEFEAGAIVNSPGGGGFGAPGASDAFTAGAVYNLTQTLPLPAKPLIGRGPTAVAVGDVNGDGFPDMVTANSKSKFLSILLGLGDGTFGQPTNILSGGTTPTDVGLADLDGDLDLDIVVTNKGTKTVGVLLNAAGVFGAPLLTPKLKQAPTALALGDVNGDLVPDVVVTHPSAGAVSVFLTGAGGVLGAQALVKTGGKGSGDVVLGDFSGDGLLDIATANGASGNASLLVNAGAGVFSITPQVFKTGTRPSALAAADFNNDGKLDLAISHAVSRFVGILIGNGAPVATFKPVLQINTPKEQLPRSIAAGDFNGDGKIDLAMGPTVGGKLRVILGAGQGDFSQPFEFDLGNKAVRQVSNLALADVNLDGQLDIITANTNSSDISVLLRKV